MTRRLSILILLVVVAAACGKNPPTLSPTGVRYYQADRGVVAIGTIQHVAIQLNQVQVCDPQPCHPLLSENNTRSVVDASTIALTTIRATPQGWKAALETALARIEERLDAAGKSELAAYIAAARQIATSF